MKWTTSDIEFLIKNYPDNGSLFCSEKLNRSQNSITKKASDLKLKISNELYLKYKKLAANSQNCFIKNIDSDLYLNIIKPEIVYMLGLLWADGHVRNTRRGSNEIVIHAVKKDIDEYYKIFGNLGKWKLQKPQQPILKNKKCQIGQTMSIVDINFKNFLIENDYHLKSSGISPDKILTKIPDNLKHLFIRGFLDGDGHISKSKRNKKCGFTSCYNQNWSFIISLCDELGCEYKIHNRITTSGKRSDLHIKQKNVITFLDYLYKDNLDIKLNRKYNKYKDLKIIKL